MDKSAVISTGNKQYFVKVGDLIEIEKIISSDQQVIFDQVLLLVEGDKVTIGSPTIAGLAVYATFISDEKGDKIQVFRYKSKSRYRKMKGHRQTYTHVKIDSIGKPKKKVTTPKVAKKPVTKKSSLKK